MVKVSIIIPVWNQEILVRKAIKSIPDREDIQVIVIDDASDDMSCVAASSELANLKKAESKLIRLNERINVGLVRNEALKYATGEYIFCLDSDDYLITDEFERAMTYLNGDDIVYINLQINDGTVFELRPETKRGYCAFTDKFVKREFWGEHRFNGDYGGTDLILNQELQNEDHTDLFTGIIAYHYNFPRENSVYDIFKNKK